MRYLSFILLFLAARAYAHTIFQRMYVDGVDQGHLAGIRVPDSNWPVMDLSSNDIICNGGVNPYHLPISQAVIEVPAGATLTAEWHPTIDNTTLDDSIRADHKGPLLAYLAHVEDPLTMNVTNLSWFKIYASGLQSGTWATDTLIANAGKVNFTIPSCIPPGAYLLRHEIIAVHTAETYPGAQFYMECAQLNITSTGSTLPPPSLSASFPGAYQSTDPGITVNITGITDYIVPGPPVFECPGSSRYLV
ncbi:glycoside hydrolase [Heliocybe sulcata]|uniref:AA9 family lytic polysaccharide monooxygenase n=1 Tax=Heliocybe sulcata TaxID=5364 RepID=A0A5C3N7Q0_9AGAM|nr:glycoside hydrolase [Heliocybe sulcata]